jgi:hypothetical protein
MGWGDVSRDWCITGINKFNETMLSDDIVERNFVNNLL